MQQTNQKWHMDSLAAYSAIMFDTLVHNFNITSEVLKQVTFEDKDGMELEPLRGYIAMKEMEGRKIRYFIDEDIYEELPIRVNSYEELLMKDSSRSKTVVFRPVNPTPFRIRPEQMWQDNHQFIDELAPFEHSNPDGSGCHARKMQYSFVTLS
jgi:hypothetical protein